jgi:hypothetical protein
MPYLVNHNAGVDTLHIEHPREECNTDDAEGLETVDDETGPALVATGGAVECEHCKPLADTEAS